MSSENLYAVAAQVGPTMLLAFVLEGRMTTISGIRSAVAFVRFMLWAGVVGAGVSSATAMTALAYPPESGTDETITVGVIVWGMLAGFFGLSGVLLLSLTTIDLTGMPAFIERARARRAAKEARRARRRRRGRDDD